MNESYNQNIKSGITRQIKVNTKQITILFTDIEDSTKYWDKSGDVAGRLMVDKHNRLLFPVIKKFKGKIIKTIGDSIMASFKKSENAIKASIAMQQILKLKRIEDSSFQLKVRIGVHTGKAIVEHEDVFGDVVNVAARVEGEAKGNEILLSGSSVYKLNNKKYAIEKKGSFIPKGKKESINLYRCKWQELTSFIEKIKFDSILPFAKRQKLEFSLYTLIAIAFMYSIFINYLRYFIADNPMISLLILNPINNLSNFKYLIPIVVAVALLFVFFIKRLKQIPVTVFRIIKGITYAGIFFVIFFVVINNLSFINYNKYEKIIYKSKHLFVEIIQDTVSVLEKTNVSSNSLKNLKKGNLLLLMDVKKTKILTWNKLLIEENQYGWIPRVLPPEIGIPERRICFANKFYFRKKDLYSFLFALFGFIWGFFSFRIKPV